MMMPAAFIAMLQVCSTWGCWPQSPSLTAREAAVLECFQRQPWVDRDDVWLDQCFAKIPSSIWKTQR
jgi:hypothetical protein